MIEELIDDLVKEYKLLYYWSKQGKGSAKRKLAKVKAKIRKKAKASLNVVKAPKYDISITMNTTGYVDRKLRETWTAQDDEIDEFITNFSGVQLPYSAEIPCDGCCGIHKRGEMVITEDLFTDDEIILCLECYKQLEKLK